ncbi:hypothetical protein PIB30_055424 [Stylosanthes scabra]|uniref:Uncharacterized protein n=1 Tax=Stylosanthes scabra TaxID=79078 RepID=A0ABU6ZHR8_9FABA|nr:hypothetical protein [Stylosanthes scabra]
MDTWFRLHIDTKPVKGTLLSLVSGVYNIYRWHTKSNPLAKGKTKVHRPPLRASPRLAALRSRGNMQPQLQAPDVPAENILMPILPPKKRLTYRMAREGSSREGTKLPCRRSQRIAALNHAKSQTSEEQEVIALSSDSEHEKDGNLEADAEGALPAAEGGLKRFFLRTTSTTHYGQCWMLSRRMKLKKFLVNGTSTASLTTGEREEKEGIEEKFSRVDKKGRASRNTKEKRNAYHVTSWALGTRVKNIWVYATILIGEMKGKSKKAGIGWEPRAFLTRYTRVNERKHDRVRLKRAKFGAEVAKESTRNEKIAKKSLKAKSRVYAYAPKEPVRTHYHALGVTS